MTQTVLLEIISPEKTEYTGEIMSLICPSHGGKLGVLPLHADLIAHLTAGELNITDKDGNKKTFPIKGGFLEAHPHRITILTI